MSYESLQVMKSENVHDMGAERRFVSERSDGRVAPVHFSYQNNPGPSLRQLHRFPETSSILIRDGKIQIAYEDTGTPSLRYLYQYQEHAWSAAPLKIQISVRRLESSQNI